MVVLLVGQYVHQSAGQQPQVVTSQQGRGGTGGGQTLVISQNANGGIRVVDRTTNRELVNTNNLQLNENNEAGEANENTGLVAGLLEWIEEKKRKKKEKEKEKQPIILPIPMPQPLPQPLPLPYRKERKEIHIHINNHIRKDHGKKPHKQQHHHKHGHHYEEYHDGHGDHGHHDKYYHGKHSYPLLGHHMLFDHYDHHDHSSGDHGQHSYGHDHQGGGADDYSGYESRGVAQYMKASGGARKRMGAESAKSQPAAG